MDESDDGIFYEMPRLVVHIDDAAIAATTDLYRAYLPSDGDILDLMSSWRSHLPEEASYRSVTGLGMNAVEMQENPQLTDVVVHNLNKNPQMPFPDQAFGACVLAVSVQYLIHPIEVFREVGRVLRPEAPFVTIFSNRMFPTKAVAIWQALDDEGHLQLIETYYQEASCFDEIEIIDCSAEKGDPLYAVVGRRITKS